MKQQLLALAVASLPLLATADEGMWQPHQLPELSTQLKARGLKLDPAQLTNLTSWPMNAVISLDGCTASFVSPKGLVVTNHHCAYGSIQFNSTPEKNILRDGFLAKRFADELPAEPGARVLVTVAVDDVSSDVLKGLDQVAGKARFDQIDARKKALVSSCEADVGHRCEVYSFHGGLSFFRIKQLEIRDVRLVYNPPEATGKFGGDIDNWMWPRHTGDYSFYRAYVGKDGKPADYSADNIPFTPPSHLKIADNALQAGDYVMVAGYPGRTFRYRLADEVQFAIDHSLPYWKAVQDGILATIARETEGRDAATIAYADLVAWVNNYAKNVEGQLDAFSKSDVINRKQAEEQALANWYAAKGGDAGSRYAADAKALQAAIDAEQAASDKVLIERYLSRATQLYPAAGVLYRNAVERAKPDAERESGYQQRDQPSIKEGLQAVDRRFDPAVEAAIVAYLLGEYSKLPADKQNKALHAAFGFGPGQFELAAVTAKVKAALEGSELRDPAKRLAWLERPQADFEASQDPLIQLAVAMLPAKLADEAAAKELTGTLEQLRSRYMAALIAKRQAEGQPVYADANSTLRVTYGTVKGYPAADAVWHAPFTTLPGLFEKETGADPFIIPASLSKAVKQERFGNWLDSRLGSVPVNFLSTVDTTGGNSGSPTLNAEGELVGLLFDGNWQSINANWDYSERQARSIHVDIRYVLWLMAEVDGADNLLKEMGVRF